MYAGHRGWRKPPKVLFVVENRIILNGAADVYAREMDLKNVARVYGGQADTIDDDVDLIAKTRSGYYLKMDRIHELLVSDIEQPWFIVVDEAHHLGTHKGQFSEILDDLNSLMDHRHLGLTLSATLWHEDAELIRDLLKGKVYGPLLSPAELVQLRRGENLPEIARVQVLRAMQQGYLTAMNSYLLSLRLMAVTHPNTLRLHYLIQKPPGIIIAKVIKQGRLKNIADRGCDLFSHNRPD